MKNQHAITCEALVVGGGIAGLESALDRAVTIGLLPDIDRSRFTYLGNSSAAGAYLALLSETHRREAMQVSNAMTYGDFSSNPGFMEEFTSARFLPHTDLEAFPGVKALLAAKAA